MAKAECCIPETPVINPVGSWKPSHRPREEFVFVAAGPVSRRIESALERLVESPFTRRASVDLPLLKSRLRRAMEDELKSIPPSSYRLVVPASQLERVRANLPWWEEKLREYYLDVVLENGWSAIGPPKIEIVADPRLRDSVIPVEVREELMVHGRTLRRKRRAGFVGALAATVAMAAASLYLLLLLLAPGFLPEPIRSPRILWDEASFAIGGAIASTQQLIRQRWDETTRSLGEAAERVPRPALGGERGMADQEMAGEVVASPGLVVRAGSPSTQGGTRAGSRFPRGAVIQWKGSQVVKGEMVDGDDRWIEIGQAGPEWGDRSGQKLYIWMGGVRVR